MRDRKCKTIVAAGLLLTLSLSLFGCGKEEAVESHKITIDVETLADKIVTEGSFQDDMNPLDEEQFDAVYEGVDESLISKKCIYTGTGATAEQVVVLEAKDDASAEKLKEQLHTKLEEDIEENKDYLPKEVSKLESAVLEVKENYAIMVVSGDNDRVEEIVNQECE